MDHADTSTQTLVAVARPVKASRPVLVLLEGPQAADAPRTFRLQAKETYLGRGNECAVLCPDPGVSRRHAMVLVTAFGHRLVDLQSRNGTFLNGVKITQGELQEGDRVQLGPSTVFRFSLRGGEEESSSAARRRAALKAVPAAIWECRLPEGRVRWSAQVDQVLGFAPGTFVGRTGRLTEFVAAEDRAQVAQAVADAAGSGKELNLEFRLAVNGSERWVACNGDVLRDAHGQPIRLIGTLTDISGRKRLEEELRKQVALFESLYDGVVMGGLDGRIQDWNPSAQAMFGYSRQEAVGAMLFELLGASQPRRLGMEMGRALLGQGRWTAELELRTRNGESRWCEIVAVVPPGQEEPNTCILTHRDVSDRKRLQAQLATSDRLASLGTLSAGIAHEINNPLAFILSNLRFLQEQLSGTPPLPGDPLHQECQEILTETREGAQRIQEIVQGLKVFARDERRDDTGPCDLRAAVELALKLSHSMLRHRVQVESELQSVPPVMGGESKWIQLTVNLLMNAVQAIPAEAAEQGRIRVRLQPSSAEWVVLEVTDNGVGIAPELRSRLFEPFFTTKGIGAGTGLGLSVCHGIATAAGGSIELESEPSAGSTFRVRVPIAALLEEPDEDATLQPEEERGLES